MALKRPNNLMATFSMASMTDVIFLLLIFFMVTSTYIFPTGLDIELPQSTEQTATKATYRIYISAQGEYFTSAPENEELAPASLDQLATWLDDNRADMGDTPTVALHADHNVPYGTIIDVLDLAAKQGVKVVLATRSSKQSVINGDATGPDASDSLNNADAATGAGADSNPTDI